jgi:Ca2+-binding EF-hand superfamily protein
MSKLAMSLLLLTFATPVRSQPGGFGRRGPMPSPTFQALDADHDGVISAEEIRNAPAALKTLDRNNDGKLTEDEVRPQPNRRPGRGDEPGETQAPSPDDMVKMLMAFDKNGDGQLTRDELPERMQGLFDRADADKNGVLTADEIRKAAQSAAAPAARGPEGGRGEGFRPGGREEGRGERPNFFRLDPILAALDTDSDGQLSPEEIAAAPTALKKLDANGDGQLSADEVRINFGPGRGPGRN